MPFGTARSEGSSGENLIHVGAVRLRVVGSGNLDLALFTLDDEKSVVNPNPLAMSATTRKEPSKLFNMISQRISLKLSTNVMDEWFRINRIIIYAKEVFVDYPRT